MSTDLWVYCWPAFIVEVCVSFLKYVVYRSFVYLLMTHASEESY